MPLKKKTYHIYQLSDATVGMTYVFCVGWYKFKCTTYMAADCRRYTRYVKWYTQCSGDDSSPCHATNTTRAVERNHLPTCRPGLSETRRAAILGWKGFSWAGENENHKARNACKPGTSGSPEGGKIREKGAKRGDLRRSGRRTGICAMCLNSMFQKCE